MAEALAKSAARTVARPLRVLVSLIQEDLKHADEAAEQAGLPYYRAAGEKLLEAREQVEHGEWGSWLRRNFKFSKDTAYRYMKLAEKSVTQKFAPARTLTSITDPPRENHQPTWHEPIKQIVGRVDTETLNLKREELKRADDREAQRTLALQLIDIGYKVLARTLHPDKGGSREAMARLNAVRDRLKQHA